MTPRQRRIGAYLIGVFYIVNGLLFAFYPIEWHEGLSYSQSFIRHWESNLANAVVLGVVFPVASVLFGISLIGVVREAARPNEHPNPFTRS